MTKIKICGITTLDDAIVAAEAGADFLGFILYPKSPRYVEPSVVRSIIAALRESELRKEAENAPGAAQVAQADCVVGGAPSVQGVVHSRLQFVGVFVNEAATTIAAILAQTGLDLAQLHGDEQPEALTALNGRAYKALRLTGFQDALESAERYWPLGPRDGPRLLLDAFDAKAYGGTGQKVDWLLAAEVARGHDNLVLAGGLTADNVVEALRVVRPWGVDVSSGVETAPGRKDHARLRAFVAAVRTATRA